MAIDKLFELGIELRDKGDLRDSVGVFSKIIDDYPNDEKISGVYLVLGGVYSDLKEHEKALVNFRMATDMNPKSELASLGLYITYVKLDRDEEAIRELIRYLRQFPANLYKDTLEELLEGLDQGYMTDFKVEINKLAKMNGVEPPDM
ncbi:MAG: tetratricopeptide repeat protein [Chryseolinea sp.]